jgi:hypothetical protein
MKQHITPEQLQELSEEQKERLREWWFKHIKVGDVFIVDGKMKSSYLSRLRQQNTLNVVAEVKRKYFGVGSIYKDYTLMKIGEVLKDGDVTIGPNPLLSIGQCIELLEEKYPNGISFHSDWGDCSEVWIVLVQDTQGDDPPDSFIDRITITRDHELIDALWQAVKEVL